MVGNCFAGSRINIQLFHDSCWSSLHYCFAQFLQQLLRGGVIVHLRCMVYEGHDGQ